MKAADSLEVDSHVNAIVKLVGSSASAVPLSLYHMLRRYMPMACVDGVPIGEENGVPFAILVRRNRASSGFVSVLKFVER